MKYKFEKENLISKMKIKPLLTKIEPDFVNQYLTACGVENVKQYLTADKSNYDNPFDYPNMEQAIDSTHQAVKDNLKTGIVIDSDMDGYCSAAIVYQFLHVLKPDLDIQVFSHKGKQHGLRDVLDEIINSKIEFLIVPDAGTDNIQECQILSDKGISILILDHHEIENENPYATIVNHHFGKDLNTKLSGTGVADKWVRAYCSKFEIEYPGYEDLVAVSIITDICSLVSLENRTYLVNGLYNLDFSNPFIEYLLNKNCFRGINSEGISFGIAPLANSLARSKFEDKKTIFFDELVGNGLGEQETLKELTSIKKIQDDKAKTITENIKSNINLDHKAIVEFIDSKDVPFSGLIAGRLAGEYHKPCIILRELNPGIYSGSMRSPIDIGDKINETNLAKCKGHKAACGIIVKKSNLKKLIDWFDTLDLDIHPAEPVTAAIKSNQITMALCDDCFNNKTLWGKDIPEPEFYCEIELKNSEIQILGKNQNTIKFAKDGVEFLKFRADESLINAVTSTPQFQLNMICKLNVNEWRGQKTKQCHIEKYEFLPINKEKLNFEDIF